MKATIVELDTALSSHHRMRVPRSNMVIGNSSGGQQFTFNESYGNTNSRGKVCCVDGDNDARGRGIKIRETVGRGRMMEGGSLHDEMGQRRRLQ